MKLGRIWYLLLGYVDGRLWFVETTANFKVMSRFVHQEVPLAQTCPNPDGAVFHHDFGALPTYEEANNPNGTIGHMQIFFFLIYALSAPPPSYDSLFGRMRETRKSSTGVVDFLKNIFILLLGTSKFWKLEYFVFLSCIFFFQSVVQLY